MRFGLKPLLLFLALFGLGAAWYFAYTRKHASHYHGYLTTVQVAMDIVRQFDPTVTLEGGGGGGGGPTGQALWRVLKLTSAQEINETYFGEIRKRLLHELRSRGVTIFMDKDLPVPNQEHRRAMTPSWGFEVMVEDQGHKGLVSFRLMPVASPDATKHVAELYENIVVFPRN